MEKTGIYLLKGLRKVFSKTFGNRYQVNDCIKNVDKVSDLIYDKLSSPEPTMIARFGSTELTCLINYLGVIDIHNNPWNFISGKKDYWWWEPAIIQQMKDWSGFFPADIPSIEQFCELFLADIPQVDILGSWLPNELKLKSYLGNAVKVDFELLNPYFSKLPWTRALRGKRVVVVHPFAHTIKEQYKKRSLLFKDDLLPEFELRTVKAVQSIAGETTEFATWFDALEYMKAEIDKEDYDICLIGCGAYGFSLAAHVKRSGRKGFHIGGSLQLLFGIRGKRWEDANYNKDYNFSALINEHWVKPDASERPTKADVVEGACYW
jgi:hypothetical protein